MKKLLFVVSLCILLTPVFAFAQLDNNLYYGLQKNSDVKQLQEFLIDKGFLTGSATGNFFSLTLKAVKAYQTSVGISSTGYVGILTRTAINNDLAANLSASNQEAANETGATPPTPTPPATTNDVVASLQAQIALLQKQLDALNSQKTTLNQIQQNTQQIAQNTTPTTPIPVLTPVPVCAPIWQCGLWNTCANSQQTRTCTDLNNCNTTSGEPNLTQTCSIPISIGQQEAAQIISISDNLGNTHEMNCTWDEENPQYVCDPKDNRVIIVSVASTPQITFTVNAQDPNNRPLKYNYNFSEGGCESPDGINWNTWKISNSCTVDLTKYKFGQQHFSFYVDNNDNYDPLGLTADTALYYDIEQ